VGYNEATVAETKDIITVISNVQRFIIQDWKHGRWLQSIFHTQGLQVKYSSNTFDLLKVRKSLSIFFFQDASISQSVNDFLKISHFGLNKVDITPSIFVGMIQATCCVAKLVFSTHERVDYADFAPNISTGRACLPCLYLINPTKQHKLM